MQKPQEILCNLAIEEALNIVSGKWSFLVIGTLSRGPQRFNQLRRNLTGVSTQSLTVILRHLEGHKVVSRQVFPTVPVTVEYSLTEKGRDFVRVLQELREWGQKWRNNGQLQAP